MAHKYDIVLQNVYWFTSHFATLLDVRHSHNLKRYGVDHFTRNRRIKKQWCPNQLWNIEIKDQTTIEHRILYSWFVCRCRHQQTKLAPNCAINEPSVTSRTDSGVWKSKEVGKRSYRTATFSGRMSTATRPTKKRTQRKKIWDLLRNALTSFLPVPDHCAEECVFLKFVRNHLRENSCALQRGRVVSVAQDGCDRFMSLILNGNPVNSGGITVWECEIQSQEDKFARLTLDAKKSVLSRLEDHMTSAKNPPTLGVWSWKGR